MMSLPHVTVLMGGPDAEREISIASGNAVAAALESSPLFEVERVCIDRISQDELNAMQTDVFFPVLHGPFGEGGELQYLLENTNTPFVGSSSEASALAMDKSKTKQVAHDLGIQTPLWCLCDRNTPPVIKAPAVIKPNNDGSSIDISICKSEEKLRTGLETAFQSRDEVLVERWVDGRELTVGIIDGDPLPVIEIIPPTDLETYDYEAKYLRNDTSYVLSPSLPTSQCIEDAKTIYRDLELRDLARVDFLLDEQGSWFLEVNTMPGFTDHSLLPLAAMENGITMPKLCTKLVQLALQRSNNFA